MNWDEDIDLLSSKKSLAKFGRRSGFRSQDSQEDDSDMPDVPIQGKKTGKWADEGNKSAKKNSTNLIEQERFQRSKLDDSDDDIPIIPDIDDLQEEAFSLQDGKPVISLNKATYKELNSELSNIQPVKGISNVGNFNLSFLTTHLCPEEKANEVDELWTFKDFSDTVSNCTL